MINIYDFDGVLADPIEDCVFRIPTNHMDSKFIELGRDRYGITKLSSSIQRNRHLILQEVLYERRIPCKAGPTLPHLIHGDPFFVLTARSGPGAVARVSEYLESVKLRPEEMFFVGPVSKTHLLIDLCEKFKDHQLKFWDDSYNHIDDAEALGFPNLETEWVDNKVDQLTIKAMEFYSDQYHWLLGNQY